MECRPGEEGGGRRSSILVGAGSEKEARISERQDSRATTTRCVVVVVVDTGCTCRFPFDLLFRREPLVPPSCPVSSVLARTGIPQSRFFNDISKSPNKFQSRAYLKAQQGYLSENRRVLRGTRRLNSIREPKQTGLDRVFESTDHQSHRIAHNKKAKTPRRSQNTSVFVGDGCCAHVCGLWPL